MSKFYDYLMASPVVYYLYNRGSIIYGLTTEKSDVDFIVVVDETFVLPQEFEQYKYNSNRLRKITDNVKIENQDFIFFTTDEWFAKVMGGELVAWECACLPKKFVHKEHVKLMLSTNPLQLRKQFEQSYTLKYKIAQLCFTNKKYNEGKKCLWELVKEVKFINQIIENHKLVNFKDANSAFCLLVNNNIIDESTILDMWSNIITPEIEKLHKATDGMLKKEMEKKIIQHDKK